MHSFFVGLRPLDSAMRLSIHGAKDKRYCVASDELCIMNFRGRAAFSISDANIQKSGTRLQAIGDFLTFQHSTKMSVFYV